MKKPRLPFDYHPQEQRGVLFLILTIFLVQLGYWGWMYIKPGQHIEIATEPFPPDTVTVSEHTIRSFNPNFITDYKGYLLGMTPGEIDRLLAYRSSGKWIRSVEDFQRITGIQDSILEQISPHFRFPDFTKKIKPDRPAQPVIMGDLNEVTREQLMEIRGIGPVLSARIIRFREALGGFLHERQLYDVYGLDSALADELIKRYPVREPPSPDLIPINTAGIEQLSALVYISYDLATAIITYREHHGAYESLEELKHVPGFPVDKIDRIGLYLEF